MPDDMYHSEGKTCFLCKEGKYGPYLKGPHDWPDNRDVECKKCKHLCDMFLTPGDIVLGNAVVAEALPIFLKDCKGSIDNAIEKFSLVDELSKPYFHVFVKESYDSNGDGSFIGYRFENDTEKSDRLCIELKEKLEHDQVLAAAKLVRYSRYLVLKEKYND
jgi:hypothetical protein